MQLLSKYYAPLPGNEFDPREKHQNDDESRDENIDPADESESAEPKTFKSSLRDALQEWSNDDARDIAEDDSTPLRSGL